MGSPNKRPEKMDNAAMIRLDISLSKEIFNPHTNNAESKNGTTQKRITDPMSTRGESLSYRNKVPQ